MRSRRGLAAAVVCAACAGLVCCSLAVAAAPLGLQVQWTTRSSTGAAAGATAVAAAPGGGSWLLIGADLVRYDAQGHEVFRRPGTFASSPAQAQPGQFRLPVAMTSDTQGRVYVSDAVLGTVQAFDPDGSLIRAYPGFHEPRGIAVTPSGELLVSDLDGIEVERLADGSPVARWTTNGTRESEALAVQSDGDTYAASGSDRVVYKFAAGGTPLGWLTGFDDGGRPGGQLGPTGVAAMPNGGLWVSDPDHRQLLQFDAADQVRRRCVPDSDLAPAVWRIASNDQTLTATSFGGARAYTFGRPAALSGWSCGHATSVALRLSDVRLRPSRVAASRLASVALSFSVDRPAEILVNFQARGRTRQVLIRGRAGAQRRNIGRRLRQIGLRPGTYRLRVAAQTRAQTSHVARLTLRVR